ncbi:hypothetical protein VE03_09200 [Pseudogymnoascus sp. 23342-1-I1]|nr:hypothetical protein VE03_09200 [Pseudogymnoascus sp. 23342-1-I1]
MPMNQTTIFHFSTGSLEQLYVQRSQLRPRTPDPPFGVWNSRLFTGSYLTLDNDDLDDAGPIEQNVALYDTFVTSKLASEPHGMPSAPAQAQPQTLPQSSKPLEDETNQQGVGIITRSTSVDPALSPLNF